MYNIIISKLATITTEYNIAFLKAFNSSYSLKIAETINNEIKNLINFPDSHPIYKKTNNNIYRKLLISGIIHVIFTVKNNNVVILYTADARKGTDIYYTTLN